jgi:hypothetical protein
MDAVSDDSDDEDVEYKGHFCLGCSIPPPGGVHGWVRGYGGVGLWEAGPGCACCEDYDWESLRVWGVGFFLFDISQLHGAATGGIGDSFVLLLRSVLSSILWCWVLGVFCARFPPLGRLALYFFISLIRTALGLGRDSRLRFCARDFPFIHSPRTSSN